MWTGQTRDRTNLATTDCGQNLAEYRPSAVYVDVDKAWETVTKAPTTAVLIEQMVPVVKRGRESKEKQKKEKGKKEKESKQKEEERYVEASSLPVML